jgi:hypothetical protein
MNAQDVLAVIAIDEATRDQKVAFMGAMLDPQWRVARQLRDACYAGFPVDVDDDQIVDDSPLEIVKVRLAKRDCRVGLFA